MRAMRPGTREKILPTFFLFLFFSLLLILFDRFGSFRPLKSGVEGVIIPLKARVYEIKKQKNMPAGRQGEETEKQQERERKIAALEAEIGALKNENLAMRRLLGAPVPSDWRFVPAQVIGAQGRESLLLDKGETEGVKEGMVVVLDNVLVGRVVRTAERFSEVLLPFSSSSKILAVSRAPSSEEIGARGLLIGQGNRLVFDQVLLKESLTTGDLLLTAGDEIFPPNLLLGKIGKVMRKEEEIYQKAEIEPLFEPQTLEIVFLVFYPKR